MKSVVAAVVLVLFTMPSLAAERSTKALKRSGKAQAQMHVPSNDPAANLTQDPGNGDTSGGYSYCVARSSYGQKCRDVVMIFTQPGTMCANGCNTCASVMYSRACSCNRETLVLTGRCVYW